MNPGFFDGLLALAVALVVSLPWFALMVGTHGWQIARRSFFPQYKSPTAHPMILLVQVIKLAPVTFPLGIYGAVRAARSALVDEFNTLETVSGSFWVIWLAVAALAPAVWPGGPQNTFDLILLVPLSLLAAQTIVDLVNRRVSVRALIGLVPATAISIAWWASDDLRVALSDLVHGRADASTALGLHLVLDVVLVSVLGIRTLHRWVPAR